MKRILEINGLRAEVGAKAQGFINVLDTHRKIPVTLINGANEGKTILTVVDTKEEKIVEQQEVKSEQEVNEVIKIASLLQTFTKTCSII